MIPLRLEMNAFGAYATQQVIDFGALNKSGLFLIHGPTGSGKSSILDAISFALYGVCSGDLRQAREMRSHHVVDDTPTEVTFDFSVGGALYRVTRRLGHERRASKAAQKPSAKVWRMSRVAGDLVEQEVLSTKITESTAFIEGLIGFKADQFNQVVVLPQGRFMELLTANSKDREAVLQVLFQSQLYRSIENELKEVRKQLESEVKLYGEKLRALLESHGAQTMEGLIEKKVSLENEYGAANEACEEARRRDVLIGERLETARNTQRLLDERTQAQKDLESLEKGKTAHQERKRIREKAALAQTLSHSEDALKARAQELEEIDKRLAEAQRTEAIAGKGLETLEKKHEKLIAQKPLMEETRERISLWKSLKEKAESYEKTSLDLRNAQQAAEKLEREVAKAREESERLSEAVEAGNKERIELDKKASMLDYARKSVTEMKNLHQSRGQLIEIHTERLRIQDLLALARDESEEADKAIKALERDFEDMGKRWTEGQAGYLAEGLTRGEPCPVCGSPEHPRPAEKATDLPSEKEMEDTRNKIKSAMDQRRALFEKISGLEQRLSELKGESQALGKTLGEWAAASVEEMDRELKKRSAVLKDCEISVQRLAGLDEEISKLTRQAREAAERNKKAQDDLAGTIERLRGLEVALREKESDLPGEIRGKKALEKRLETETRKLALMEKEWEESERGLAKAREELSSSKASLKAELESRSRAKALLDQKENEFKSALVEAGFANEEEYYGVKRSKAEIKALEEHIQEFETSLGSAMQRLDRAVEKCRGLEAPDMENLLLEARETKNRLEDAISKCAQVGESLKGLEGDIDSCKKISSEMAAVEERFAVVGRISDLANGQNPERITFHRFVLARLLEEVAMAATERLRMMSGGRYKLQRALSQWDKRFAGGLDFEVHDEYTGVARPARSLSGGETFLASLSLALGLADVTSAHSGGIRLNTVFIDEGFGSLDPEALDLALKTLNDLQAAGRIVGVISHVPELRERIGARLEVRAARRGSSVSVAAP